MRGWGFRSRAADTLPKYTISTGLRSGVGLGITTFELLLFASKRAVDACALLCRTWMYSVLCAGAKTHWNHRTFCTQVP